MNGGWAGSRRASRLFSRAPARLRAAGRRGGGAGSAAVDATLLGGLAALSIAEAVATASGAARATAIAAALLTIAPLAARRTHPLAASAAVTLLFSAFVTLGAIDADVATGPQLAVLAGLAAAALHAASLLGVAAATALATVVPAAATGFLANGVPPLSSVLFGIAFVGGAVSLARLVRGGVLRRLRLLVELDAAHAARAASAAAAQHERRRVAQELHDVVGHHLVVASMHAGLAAADARSDAGAAAAALATARTALARGRAALAELAGEPAPRDATAGALAQPTGAPPPATGGFDTGALVEAIAHARESGVAVDAPLPERLAALPAALAQTAARVLQEALTNAAKHAAGAPVRAAVRLGEGDVVVEVRNGAGAAAPLAGGGLGLVGMEERIRLLGGELQAGPPLDGAGWEVRARIPVDPAAGRPGAARRVASWLGGLRGGVPALAWLVALALAAWGLEAALWEDDGPHAAARAGAALLGALGPPLWWRRAELLLVGALVAIGLHFAVATVPATSSPIVLDAALSAFAVAGAARSPRRAGAAVLLIVAWLIVAQAVTDAHGSAADLTFLPALVLGAGVAGLLVRLRAADAAALADRVESARSDADAARAAVVAAERVRLREELARTARDRLDDLAVRLDDAAGDSGAPLAAAIGEIRERLAAALADLGRLAAVLRRS